MPTYEYECRECGLVFEKFQSIKAGALRKCVECSGKVDRLIGGGAGILFKGSGFYQTDYRSSSYQKAAAKDKPATSGQDGGSGKPKAPQTKKDSGD